MAFRRGNSQRKKNRSSSTTTTTETIPNESPSSSQTGPLLVSSQDSDDIRTMMEDGDAALMEEGSPTSPYLNAETFEPTEDELKDLKKSQQLWNLIIFSTGSAAFFFAFAAIVLYFSPFVLFCFACPIVLGPYMIRQRRIMNRFPTLRRLINRLRFQVNRLQVQNNKFAAENTRLEREIASLQQIEFKLHQLCQQSGSSIQEMQGLIKENGAIQKDMKVREGKRNFSLIDCIAFSLVSHFEHSLFRNCKMPPNFKICCRQSSCPTPIWILC